MSLLLLFKPAGKVDYVLTCDSGSYNETGVAATLTYVSHAPVNYTLVCAVGSYSYSGVATTSLKVAHKLVCAVGAYTYTGVNTTSLKVVHKLTCASGAYTFTGVSTTSLKVVHGLICTAGAYSYSGVAATLDYVAGIARVDYTLVCASGDYTYTGVAATLTVVRTNTDYVLVCNAGAYSCSSEYVDPGYGDPGYSVESAILSRGYHILADAGAYIRSGIAAGLQYHDGRYPQPWYVRQGIEYGPTLTDYIGTYFDTDVKFEIETGRLVKPLSSTVALLI